MRKYYLEMSFRLLGWAVALLCAASLLVAPETRAGNTGSVGSSSAGSSPESLGCPTDHWAIGLEVKYSVTGVRRVRLACSKLAQNGSWTGTKRYTDWSSNSNNEPETHKSGYCSSGHVVTSFRARESHPDVRALQLQCRAVDGDGLQSQSSSTGWLGITQGSYSISHICPSGEAARSFDKRSATMLSYFRLGCETLEVQDAGTSDITIPALAIYNYSKDYGFRFLARDLSATSTSKQPNCTIEERKGQLVIETRVGIPRGKGCRFDFFTIGPNLKNGWQLREVRVRGLETSGCLSRYYPYPVTPSFDLEFAYVMTSKGGTHNALCISHLESVTLRGPSDQTWRDAF
ncbi:MAG: hypothetical protein V3S33_06865 [Gammaproteobacteria bacterium]